MTLTPRSSTLPAPAAHPAGRPERLPFSPAWLWMRGVVAAVTAILAAIALLLLVRAFLSLNAFEPVNAEGTPSTGSMSAGAFVATLLAVLALHILLLTTSHPFRHLNTVFVLAYLAFAGVTLSGDMQGSQIGGRLVVVGLLALIVRPLVGWAGHASLTEPG